MSVETIESAVTDDGTIRRIKTKDKLVRQHYTVDMVERPSTIDGYRRQENAGDNSFVIAANCREATSAS